MSNKHHSIFINFNKFTINTTHNKFATFLYSKDFFRTIPLCVIFIIILFLPKIPYIFSLIKYNFREDVEYKLSNSGTLFFLLILFSLLILWSCFLLFFLSIFNISFHSKRLNQKSFLLPEFLYLSPICFISHISLCKNADIDINNYIDLYFITAISLFYFTFGMMLRRYAEYTKVQNEAQIKKEKGMLMVLQIINIIAFAFTLELTHNIRDNLFQFIICSKGMYQAIKMVQIYLKRHVRFYKKRKKKEEIQDKYIQQLKAKIYLDGIIYLLIAYQFCFVVINVENDKFIIIKLINFGICLYQLYIGLVEYRKYDIKKEFYRMVDYSLEGYYNKKNEDNVCVICNEFIKKGKVMKCGKHQCHLICLVKMIRMTNKNECTVCGVSNGVINYPLFWYISGIKKRDFVFKFELFGKYKMVVDVFYKR